ncbi:MAG: 4-hydroxythreonine-4-phosphate dehydrogenase PdxA [Planctomycetia bacterium]
MERSHLPASERPSERPLILITCGDPAGIGPEVVAAAWADPSAHRLGRLRVVADPATMAAAVAERCPAEIKGIEIISADDPRDSHPGWLLVIPAIDAEAPPIRRGEITAAGGRAAVLAVEAALHLIREGRGQAMVTGPLHKEALHAAGRDVPGHTELLARAFSLPDDAASMMLWLPPRDDATHGLGVVHATLHESLRTAVMRLSVDGIIQAGRRIDGLLTAILRRRPRIAVAAINPHAGEGGLFGDEESRLIVPAVSALRGDGIDAVGPLPADTLFLRASRGHFDGVVAMYHDQGHIPIKLLGMHRAVNITLGLPLVRTSVAHGTAFDIVGQGVADPSSMLAAIDTAARLVSAGWLQQATRETE